MRWKDLKYLIAYIAPLSAFLGVYLGGIWSFSGIYVGFVFIPLLELVSPRSRYNFNEDEESNRLADRFFDILLYFNVPILYVLVVYYLNTISAGGLANYEITGMSCSVGLMVGITGINVAHELGHRLTKWEQTLSKMLLLPALYMHFFIEHNRGHHLHVATDKDPATSRYNEMVYVFWLRSVIGGYLSAWRLERDRLRRRKLPFFSLQNEMLRFQFWQLLYLLAVGLVWGWNMVPFAIAIAVFGFLMLESVNYIEHYGLRRKKLSNGRYENVSPRHSWNADQEIGRIFLYELTRHSDHHYKSTRKYQVLRHFDESPQLPLGYPTSILMSLIPPLWFAVMNKRVKEIS